MQRAKIDWLRKGDDNNSFSFFFATIKTKQNNRSMKVLHKTDGTIIQSHSDIVKEVMDFCGNIMGKDVTNLKHTNIEAMRSGNQLNMEQREFLVSKVTEQEIAIALKCIGDLKAPGIDGYGERFFKASWHIIKEDVKFSIIEFFDTGRIYKLLIAY
ncbi:uncharacterized protein LOC131641351 [Vicia villosa]|uniref:uncharacterized protein LOC131641351 n=1 Tax=Vicia villosa TaxID=3911 RepID=UPI00273CCF9F|nr:uncharacterized protein LOC131641351 [Vicia villosa]